MVVPVCNPSSREAREEYCSEMKASLCTQRDLSPKKNYKASLRFLVDLCIEKPGQIVSTSE